MIRAGCVLLAPAVLSLVFVGWLLRGAASLLFALVSVGIARLIAHLTRRDDISQPGWRMADLRRDPELVADVAVLAVRANIATPRITIADSDKAFAFVADRCSGRATIAVSTSLLALLTRDERCGVLAHEIAHLAERETLAEKILAATARRAARMAHPGSMQTSRGMMLLSTSAGLLTLFASRRREFLADRHGAALCGNPLWLASALRRLHDAAGETDAPRHPFTHLFSTHPHATQRIEALLALAGVDPARASEVLRPRTTAHRWRPFGARAAPRPDASFLGGYGLHPPVAGRSW